MMKSNFIKDFTALFSSRMLNMVIAFFSSIFLNRVLGPEGVGLKSIVTNFPTMFSSFSEMGMRQSATYQVGRNEYSQNRIFSACFVMWLITSFSGLLIYLVVSQIQMPEVASVLIMLSALFIPLIIGQSYIGGFLVGNNMMRVFAKFDIATNIIVLGLTILLVWFFKLDVLGYLIAVQSGAFVMLIVRLLFLKRKIDLKIKLRFERELIVKMLSHGVLYGLALFLSANLKQVPIFLMNGRIDAYDIGIYSAGFSFANIINNVFISMSPILFARSARSKDPAENSKKSQMLLRVIIPALVVGTFVISLGMQYIIPLFYGAKYDASVPITNVLIWGVVFFNVFAILHMDMAGKGNPTIAIKALVPAFVICVMLNYFSIESMGIMGAAVSTTIAMACGAIIYLILYAKEASTSIIEIIKPRSSDWIYVLKLTGLKK